MAHQGAGEIRTTVTVTGDVSGQLAVGDNIVQMRVDRVLGNVVTVLPPGARPNVTARPHPIRLVPPPPTPVFDRVDETAQVIAELGAHRSVAVHAASGMGKSTLVRHLAHHPDVAAAYGAVVWLSARGLSRDDLLQALFEAFYTSDVPVRPTRVQLRHLLSPVHAAVLLDDIDLPDDAVVELQELAPNCGFVLAGVRKGPWGAAASVPLAGLPVDAAGDLLAYVLGHPLPPTDQGAVYALWGLTRGAPARLVQLGATATARHGPLEAFTAAALHDGPPPFLVESPADRHLLGLLAAVPDVPLTAEQLATITGLPDVEWRLQRWIDCGVVTASATGYGFAAGDDLDPGGWELEQRRAQLVAYFANWARQHPDAVLVAGGSAEPVRALQETARRHGAWRAVIALGLLLDVAYALSGRWDAWHSCLQATLEAARAVGDQAVEALALHQLGCRALGLGDLATAGQMLGAALDLHETLGDHAAAEVTRNNLATITVPPVPPVPVAAASGPGGVSGALANVPMAVKIGAVLIPLLGGLAFVGLGNAGGAPQPRLAPERLAFTGQAVDQASPAQTIRLDNAGSEGLHVDNVLVSGPNHGAFTLVDTTCIGEITAKGSCTATVVFTPANPGAQQAVLAWRVQEIPGGLAAQLDGTGVPATASAVTVDPATVTFGAQPRGQLSAPQRVRLTAGSAPVRMGAAAVQGVQAADFLIDGDGCAGALLAPRAACTVGVRFTPGAAGERSALLTVTAADGGQAATVALAGTGTAPTVAVGVAPSALAFGDHPVGTASAGQAVTLTNRGGAPVDLGTATVAGSGDFAVTGEDCPATLDPGRSCTTTVVFTPSGPGPRTAQLVLAAPGRPSVPLRGAGVARPAVLPDLTPSVVAFGEHPTGTEAAPQVVTLTNRADAPLRLTGITVDDAGKAFRVDAATCTDTTLPPGGSCRITVGFGPAKPGAYSGALSVGVQGVPGRATTTFTGSATDPNVVVVPNVVGLPLIAAQRAIAGAELQTGLVTHQQTSDAPPGTVTSQNPQAGGSAKRGDGVDVVVADPVDVEVPNLIGQPQADATARLAAIGLRVGRVDQRPDPSIADGAVVACDPPSGTRVKPGSAVVLTVSTGVEKVTVPNVVNQPYEAARALLEQDGKLVAAVTDAPDPQIPVGNVVSTDPPAGRQVDRGSTVKVVRSAGPAVPKVVGGTLGEAKEALKGVGMTADPIVAENGGDFTDSYVVTSSDPKEGEAAPTGKVALTVKPPPDTPVP